MLNQNDTRNVVKAIKTNIGKYYPQITSTVIDDIWDEVINTKEVHSQAGVIWEISHLISETINPFSSANIWNIILNKVIGYDYVCDRKGESIIHPNEPMQAVFFNTKAFKVLDVFENKYPEVEDKTPTSIVIDNILLEPYKKRWQGTMTEVKDLLKTLGKKGWRLPTKKEWISIFNFVQNSGKKPDPFVYYNISFDYYWCADESKEGEAWAVDFSKGKVEFDSVYEGQSFNIRFVKDV